MKDGQDGETDLRNGGQYCIIETKKTHLHAADAIFGNIKNWSFTGTAVENKEGKPSKKERKNT